MDKDKKLEQFFKNRVNKFDSTSDDWDMPDASVFQNAQSHFPKHPKKREKKAGFILWFLMGLFLLSMLGYIFYLNHSSEKVEQKAKDLELKLDITKAELKENQIEITDLKNDFSQIKSKLESQISSNPTKTLTHQNQNFRKIINQKDNRINSLVFENQTLKNQLASLPDFSKKEIQGQVFSKKIKYQKEQATAILNTRDFYFLKNKKTKLQIPIHHSIIITKPNPRNRHKGKIEIGLSYTSLNFSLPLKYDFEKLEGDKFGKKEFDLPIQTIGGSFYFAYSVRPNLWVTTEFRRTSGGFKKPFFSELIYDKTGEYIDGNGKTINEFDIKTQSSFGDTGNSIGFEIPTGADIQDGEFLKVKWNYEQQFKLTHIPIGLNYFFGKNNFQGFLKGGLGWNYVSFGEYFVETELQYENEVLPITKSEKSKSFKSNSQFLNAYAGIGLNYQLTQNWNARTSFSFEKNITSSNKIIAPITWSKIFDIGLNYRF